MKNLTILFLFFLTILSASAQKVNDTILVSIDTINVHGKVVDERGKPIYNALILSETFDKNYNIIQTTTNKGGLFKLEGIKPTDYLRIRKEEEAIHYSLKGSRYLYVVMAPMIKLDLNENGTPFSIGAKRVSPREKYNYKNKDTALFLGFHPFGHFFPATYPGGRQKFYDFIKTNIIYPEKAIKNNIEGIVAIEFTIDRAGNYKDFFITRDIGYGCADETIRVIKKSKKWNSSFQGSAVNQRISLEIPFKLLD